MEILEAILNRLELEIDKIRYELNYIQEHKRNVDLGN